MDIVPFYKCNLRCPFCFQRDNWEKAGLLDLDVLKAKLEDAVGIRELSIVGGEPTLLNDAYLKRLINICRKKLDGGKPDFYTNLILVPNKFVLDNVNLHVSYDPCDRQQQRIVLQHMLELDVPYTINMVLTKKLVKEYGAEKVVRLAEKMHHRVCLSVIRTIAGGDSRMQPSPEELAGFALSVDSYGSKLVDCSVLRSLHKDHQHHQPPEVRFDYALSIEPNGRFRAYAALEISTMEFDSYDECRRAFVSASVADEECASCKYDAYCIEKYKAGGKCVGDRIVMEKFEEATA